MTTTIHDWLANASPDVKELNKQLEMDLKAEPTQPASSSLEDEMMAQIVDAELLQPVREFVFHPKRKWRLDFYWDGRRVALEVEGGTWAQGRHVRPQGFEGDCEKYNEAALRGIYVLRVTGDMVRDGRALAYLRRALLPF